MSEDNNAEELDNNTVEYNSYLDELIIRMVKNRPALYDLRLPEAERTRETRQELWIEISNCTEGQLKPRDIEHRWKYLRENYLKARRKLKMREEMAKNKGVPLTNYRNKKYAYRYYKIMQYLDDSLDYQKALQLERASLNKVHKRPSQRTKLVRKAAIKKEPYVETEKHSLNESEPEIVSDKLDELEIGLIEYPTRSAPEPQISFSQIQNNTELRRVNEHAIAFSSKQSETSSEIDNYLMRLGAGLKRLPYEVRCELEIEFLKRVLDEEKKNKANNMMEC